MRPFGAGRQNRCAVPPPLWQALTVPNMIRTNSYILVVLLLLCAGVAGVEIALNLQEETISASTDLAWAFFYVVLVSVWVQRDSRGKDFEKPFDFGLFLYLFLPFLLFYYLVRTRGFEGVITYLGFLFVYWLPWLSGWVAYAYFT
jgi:hypothetical protein